MGDCTCAGKLPLSAASRYGRTTTSTTRYDKEVLLGLMSYFGLYMINPEDPLSYIIKVRFYGGLITKINFAVEAKELD